MDHLAISWEQRLRVCSRTPGFAAWLLANHPCVEDCALSDLHWDRLRGLAVREFPDERTIEHGCHCDEREANDEPGPRLGFAVPFACVHDRPSIVKWPRPVHASAAGIGRIRALTPRVRRAVPSSRLRAGETRATRAQMVRAAYLLHPRIRGDLIEPFVHRSSGGYWSRPMPV